MHFDLATAFHKPIEQLASAKNWDLANKLGWSLIRKKYKYLHYP